MNSFGLGFDTRRLHHQWGRIGFDRAEIENGRFGVVPRKQPKTLDANDDIYNLAAAA